MILEEFDYKFKSIFHQLDILEQKFKSKWFPKKKVDLEDGLNDTENGESEKHTPKDLRSKMFLVD